jgi:uncharacterized membrane protein
VSEFIVLAFTDRYRAPEVLNELRRNEGPWSEILERALVLALDEEGRASVQMNVDLTKREAVAWAQVWGALLKAILFVPITDGISEAADKFAYPSVQPGWPPEVEPDECNEIKWWRESLKQAQNFRRDAAALIGPNTSAVLMLVRKIKLSDALENLEKYATTIVHTTISAGQDEQLSRMLKRKS